MKTFYGARLRLARISQGLTLAELGEKVEASRQYIQKLESNSDASPPSGELLPAFAEILKVKKDFFCQPVTGQVHEDECFFRRLKTTPLNIRTRALAYGTIFNMIYLFIEDKIQLPNVNIPTVSVNSREDIEKASEKCREKWGLGRNTPINNVLRTLENNGCIVVSFRGVSDKIDAFSYYRDRPIIVRSLEKGSSSRARFDLAHECGHIVMHTDAEIGDPILEEEANNFASSFLLPREAFMQEFPSGKKLNYNKLYEMKIRWGVAFQAIIRRAYDLGLITAVQYRSANIYISRTRQKKNEYYENKIPFENAEIIPNAFILLEDEYDLSSLDVAQIMNMSCDYFEMFDINCDKVITKNKKLVSMEKYKIQKRYSQGN